MTVARMAVVLMAGLGVVSAMIIGTNIWWRNADQHLQLGDGFETIALFDAYYLDDLGVADIDDDGLLDVFTTNHSAQQHMLLGRSDGGFEPVEPSRFGLDHSPAFPGSAAATSLPPIGSPGLFISHFRTAIVVRAVVDGRAGRGSGEISFPWAATAASTGGISFVHDTEESVAGTAGSRIAFSVEDDGELWIEPQPPPSDGFPIEIALTDDFALDQVRVGSLGIRPEQRRFILTPKDRHGMAWADYDGDDHMDVFISRGAVRGRAEFVGVEHDEFFSGDDDGFRSRIARSGIEKQGCPGRQVGWVDVDGDNRLDLYVACGRGEPPGDRSPNRLYRQRPDGTFVESAEALNLAIASEGIFAWLDVEGDGDPDLLWADRQQLTLFRNAGASFSMERIAESGGRPRKLTLDDFDADGDLDAYVVSRSDGVLLIGEGGRFRLRDPSDLGLPTSALTASWVDFDNDGAMDLAAVPGGIYRQIGPGRFVPNGLLDASAPFLARVLSSGLGESVFRDARASWFDANRDGALDVVIGVEPCWPGSLCGREGAVMMSARRWLQDVLGRPPPPLLFETRRWLVGVFQARPTRNHWLAVDVIGPTGNRDSIGARLMLRTARGARVAEVGQLDGAHYSQGNRRLHFGLGDQSMVDALEVRWPDGEHLMLKDLPADRLIEASHPHRVRGSHGRVFGFRPS